MKSEKTEEESEKYMRQCLNLARLALEAGNPPVGAIIVHEGKVVGKGIESGKTTDDITNHAEILAIRDAIANGYKEALRQSCMYTTHEPCIMCSYVIRHHQIPDIVYGVAVPILGGATSAFAILATNEIVKWGEPPSITSGICEAECITLNKAFQEKIK